MHTKKVMIVVLLLFAVVSLISLSIFIFDDPGDTTIHNEYMVTNDSNVYQTRDISIYQYLQKAKKDVSNIPVTQNVTIGVGQVSADSNDIWSLIQKYSTKYSLDPLAVAAICSQESNFGKDLSTSHAGAEGLMQVVAKNPPKQLKEWGRWDSDMTMDLQNNDNNMNVACAYLKGGMDYFVIPSNKQGDVGALAAGYNSWWASTIRNNPPYLHGNTENTNYYNQVRTRYEAYKTGALKIGEKY